MAGKSDPNGKGFYGKGFWGRSVFWNNWPVRHQELDVDGYLENLLKTFGDETGALVDKIRDLPLQREPYEVRGHDGEGEFFYFTEVLDHEDGYWGNVVRLIGEKKYADMPETDEDVYPSGSAGLLSVGDSSTLEAVGDFFDGDMEQPENLLFDGDMEIGEEDVIVDGGMDNDGVLAWTVGQSAIITKESVSPYSGLRNLKIEYNGLISPNAYQLVMVVGKTYRVKGVARSSGSGNATPRIRSGSVLQWVGTLSTEWQPFDVTFTQVNNNVFQLYSGCSSAGEYVEFDAVEVIDESRATENWGAGNLAVLEKKDADPFRGSQYLRVSNGSEPSPYAVGNVDIEPGRLVRVNAALKSDGVNNAKLLSGADGIDWTSRSSAADNQWQSVTYGNGLFVAVANSGSGNRVMTSPDGIIWTIRTSAADNSWFSVTYGNGLFVAVAISGTGNRVMTSPDGIIWTIRTSAADNQWFSVTYGNGLFVAVAASGSGNRVMTSPDGIIWTIRTSAANNIWLSVTYGNGLFVAVASSGTGNRVMTSPDGIIWTIRTSAADNSWRSVTYGNGLFVAVATTGTGNRVMTSPDGIIWTIRTSAADNDWQSVTCGNGLFATVATTGSGNRVMTSDYLLIAETTSSDWVEIDDVYQIKKNLFLMSDSVSSGYAEFDSIYLYEVADVLDGDMEEAGVSDWTAMGSTVLTKESGDPSGGGGTQVLRVEAVDSDSEQGAAQGVLIDSYYYRVKGWARSVDGNYAPKVGLGDVVSWSGTASTDWQQFDFTGMAHGTDLKFYFDNGSGAGSQCEFDDIEIERLSSNIALNGDMEREPTLLNDGSMEASGVAAWSAGNSATLTKTTNGQYRGQRSLRVAYNGVGNPFAYQVAVVIGKRYRLSGSARGDGSVAPNWGNNLNNLWYGSVSTAWQEFDETFVAVHDRVHFQLLGSSGYVEFDDLELTLVDDNAVWDGDMERSPTLLEDGDMEDTGTSAWIASGTVLTKETSDLYRGNRFLRATNPGGTPRAEQHLLVVGKTYRVTGAYRASTGGGQARIYVNAPLQYIGGTGNTTWTRFDFTFVAGGEQIWLRPFGGSTYADFDDIELTLLDDNAVWDGDMERSPTLLVDGDCEDTGVSAWGVGSSATITKQTSGQYRGDRLLRVAYNGVNYPHAYQDALIVGKKYRISGVAKSDGSIPPKVYCLEDLWIGTTSTDWQSFDETFYAKADRIRFYANGTSSGYCEFDDLELTLLDDSLFFDSDMDREWGLLKDGDCESPGVSAWTVENSATLTKETDGPYGGDRVIRITKSGSYGGAFQTVLVAGNYYRVTGVARGDGASGRPRINDAGTPFLWEGTASSSWQEFSFEFIARGTGLRLLLFDDGGYCEFDNVKLESIVNKLVDGNMERTGVLDWTAGQSATLTKQATGPHAGLQWLRVFYNGLSFPSASQVIFEIGKKYRVSGWARGDGTYAPRVGTSVDTLWTGTVSPVWQSFDFEFDANSTTLFLISTATNTGYAGFDSVLVVDIGNVELLSDGYMDRETTLLADGDCEALGTAFWSPGSSSLSKQSGAKVGSNCLRITRTTANSFYALQGVCVAGKRYTIKGYARGDGDACPSVWITSGSWVKVWSGTNSAEWQYFDVDFVAGGSVIVFQGDSSTPSSYVEFDDLELSITNELKDGNMEFPAVVDWASDNDAVLTKVGDAYEGFQCLRIAYDGASNPGASRTINTGIQYRVSGWARSDGYYTPKVVEGGVALWTGTLSREWQYFDKVFVNSSDATLKLQSNATAAGYVEFDNVVFKPTGNVMSWVPSTNAVVTKQNSDASSGTLCLRVEHGGTDDPNVIQNVLSSGYFYRVKGIARSDGNLTPRILVGSAIDVWSGTTSTDWQEFDEIVTTDTATVYFFGIGTGSGNYVEFDCCSIEEVASVFDDGDMEGGNTSAWTAGNSATLTKDSTSPYSGSQCLRVAYNAVTDPYAYQSNLISGRRYRVTGWARGDGGGNATPSVYSGSTLWTGTVSYSWQRFDVMFDATGTQLELRSLSSVSSYSEFDDVVVTQIGVEDDWLSANSAFITKNSIDPYGGGYSLRVSYDGVSFPNAYQTSLVVGDYYRMKGWGRGDGSAEPRFFNPGATGEIWRGTSSNLWQYFDEVFVATDPDLKIYGPDSSAGYTEFDSLELLPMGHVMDWLPHNSALLSKRGDNPYEGDNSIRVSYDGLSNPAAKQEIFKIGDRYNVRGYARGDGTYAPIIASGSTFWTGTSSTAWQLFDVTFAAGSTFLFLFSDITGSGYVEFDDVLVNPIGYVMNWVPANASVLTKSEDGPYGGDRCLRVEGTGTANPAASQTCIRSGDFIRVRGYVRTDGNGQTARLSLSGAAITDLPSSTSWAFFDVTDVAKGTEVFLYSDSGNGEYVEFDDVIVESWGYVMDWAPHNDALLSPRVDGPQNGSRLLRVSYDGTSNPGAKQEILTVSDEYRISGYARSDGTYVPRIENDSVLWSGTISTEWQHFDVNFTASGSGFIYLLSNATSDGYVEFDSVDVEKRGYVMDWHPSDSDTDLNKSLGNRTSGSGSRLIKVDSSVSGEGYAKQPVLTDGDFYRVKGYLKSESGASARVRVGDSVVLTDDSGSWKYFEKDIVSDGEDIQIGSVGGIAYFDDVEVESVSNPESSEVSDTELDEWFPWWPYSPAKDVSRYWSGKWDGATHNVAKVRLRNFDWPSTPYVEGVSLANEVWVEGNGLSVSFDYLSDFGAGELEGGWSQIGTGDGSQSPSVLLPFKPVRLWYNDTESPEPWLTGNSKVRVRVDLQSAGADFDLYDVPDDVGELGKLYPESATVSGSIDNTVPYGTVNYLSGEIVLDLSVPGDSVMADSVIRGKWLVRGYFIEFHPQSMIERLSRDYGFDNDLNDPEDVQRSTIANITKYFGLKSTADSYRVRGEVSLFNVVPAPLWYICDSSLWETFPPQNRFSYDGVLYTDLDPRYIKYDDIPIDVLFYDPDVSDWLSLVDVPLMHVDTSGDGHSSALAFGLDVTQGYYGFVAPSPHVSSTVPRDPATVLSSTILTEEENKGHRLVAGYRVVVQMMRVQWDSFNFVKGKFGISEYDKSALIPPSIDDTVFWIDVQEVEWTLASSGTTSEEDVGTWTVLIGVGVDSNGNALPGPVVGSDVAVRYWPKVDTGDCCHCRSYKMRALISPADEAYDFYDTEATMVDAIERMKSKIDDKIRPMHSRIVDWEVERYWTLEGVSAGSQVSQILPDVFSNEELAEIAGVDQGNKIFTLTGDYTSELFDGGYISVRGFVGPLPTNNGVYQIDTVSWDGSETHVKVLSAIPSAIVSGSIYVMPNRIIMKVEQRGEMGDGQTQIMKLYDDASAVVWNSTLGSGIDDAENWSTVVSDVDVTLLIGNNVAVKIEATGDSNMSYGDVRFTFSVSK